MLLDLRGTACPFVRPGTSPPCFRSGRRVGANLADPADPRQTNTAGVAMLPGVIHAVLIR